jgi:hypothetical protein
VGHYRFAGQRLLAAFVGVIDKTKAMLGLCAFLGAGNLSNKNGCKSHGQKCTHFLENE